MVFAHDIDVPRPSANARDKALRLLGQSLGPSRLLTGPEACERFAGDESEAEGRVPDAVVLAETKEDIRAALAAAREAEIPITPRAGGTGRSGGAVPVAGGIVLSVLGMRSIKEIDAREGLAVVEPGVVLADLHAEVEREGLFYPPDPNSLTGCALGGNVAENAGGPRAFKYGVTRDYVLGLEAFLVGGECIQAGRRTRKGVTGYDVTSLLVGSEGTLAVFGDITLKLRRKPPAVVTLLALFSDVRAAGSAVSAIIAQGLLPRCIELLDSATLQAMRDAGNSIDARAGALLLMETDGEEDHALHEAELIGERCEGAGALEVLAAQDASQRDRLWAARREMSPAVRRLARYKLSEDVVVPRQCIGELLERVAEQSERSGIRSLTYGHAGDGNLHVNFLWNDPDEFARVQGSIEQLFKDVVALRGTLSGEHGIGVLKAPYLSLEQSPDLINLQKNLKQVFDPKGLLNPGKIFTTGSHGSCELETIEAQQARTHAMIVALGLSWVGVGLLYAAIPERRPEPARSLAFLPPWTVRGAGLLCFALSLVPLTRSFGWALGIPLALTVWMTLLSAGTLMARTWPRCFWISVVAAATLAAGFACGFYQLGMLAAVDPAPLLEGDLTAKLMGEPNLIWSHRDRSSGACGARRTWLNSHC